MTRTSEARSAGRVSIRFAATAAAVALVVLSPEAALAEYTFTKVVDTSTFLPGSGSTFDAFSYVGFDGDNVALIAAGSGNEEGVYIWNHGGLSVVADTSTVAPSNGGSTSVFDNFANISIDNGSVAFQGTAGARDGVFTNLGGALRTVADTSVTMPGAFVPFTEFLQESIPSQEVSISGDNIVFSAFGNNGFIFNEGVYRERGGVLERIADRSITPPGETQSFVFFGEVAASGDDVLFYGRPDTGGLWTTQGAQVGSVRKVVDRNSTLPDIGPPIVLFAPNTYSIDGQDIAFMASDGDTFEGYLYMESAGALRLVVSENDTNPITGTPFVTLDNRYSLSEGRVLFKGRSDVPGRSIDGIYLADEPGFETIVSELDGLDGKALSGLSLFEESLSGRDFVFRASFDDGSTGIYLAEAAPTGPTDSVTTGATVDFQLRPGNDYPIGDADGAAIFIDGGSGATFPRLDAMLEFPLDGVPEGASLTSATLEIDAVIANSITVEVLGYAGDGLASLSDETATTQLLGAVSLSGGGIAEFELDAGFVESLLGQSSHLGLRLASGSVGPFTRIASSESTSNQRPMLTLHFTSAGLAGDYNTDGVVDVADYTVWRDGLGVVYTADDYMVWKNNFGATSSGPPSESSAVPEPAAVMLLAALAVGSGRRCG